MNRAKRLLIIELLALVLGTVSARAGTRAPYRSNKTITVGLGPTVTMTHADWEFCDPLNSPPNQFLAVRLTNLPAAGMVNSVNVTGQAVSMLEAPAGEVWTARGNARWWQCLASSADQAKVIDTQSGGQLYTYFALVSFPGCYLKSKEGYGS